MFYLIMKLIKTFIQELEKELPKLDFSFNENDLIVSIHSNNEEFGNIEIEDDYEELIVEVGNFTHWHAGCYEEGLSEQEMFLRISESVIDFIKDLINDEIVLWGSHKNGGGFYYPEHEKRTSKEQQWVWSGKYEN